jgi:hypothetical protein
LTGPGLNAVLAGAPPKGAARWILRPGDAHTTVTRFGLAPTSADIRLLTRIVLAVPLLLAVGAALAQGAVRDALLAGTVLVGLLYASVWLFGRPTRFEVDRAGLRILWPLRIRSIPAHEIVEAVALSRETFRREFGWGSRIGAGGLWGGFGWVYTRKGWVGLYVSRTDRFVLLGSGRTAPCW